MEFDVFVDNIYEFESKAYYNSKRNSTCLIMEGEKCEVVCSEEDHYDKYVGVALALAKNIFGSNTKFREFVDEIWKGPTPDECDYASERKYAVGERVLFVLGGKETIGIVTGYTGAKGYFVSVNDKELLVRDTEIIRKMRRANKPKENKNGENNK